MGLTRHCYFAALIGLAATNLALADTHRRCQDILSDVDRLACYDASAASPVESADPAAKMCKQVLLAALKTPGTYRSVNQNITGDQAVLTYDAENSFGALVREIFSCRFVHNPSGYRIIAPEFAKSAFDNVRIPQETTALSSPVVPEPQKAPSLPSKEELISDCMALGEGGHDAITLDEADGSHTVIVRKQANGPALFSCHFPTNGAVTLKHF